MATNRIKDALDQEAAEARSKASAEAKTGRGIDVISHLCHGENRVRIEFVADGTAETFCISEAGARALGLELLRAARLCGGGHLPEAPHE